jgi:hypothetical protein
MQKMPLKSFNILIALLLIIVVGSCSNSHKQRTSGFKDYDVKFTSSLLFIGKKRDYQFPWKIKLPVNAENNLIIPKTCHDFKKIISDIYPADFKNSLFKASIEFKSNGNKLIFSTIDGINDFYEFLEYFFQVETGESRDGYFLTKSIDLILKEWNIKYDTKSKILCPNYNPGFEYLINMADFLILETLLASKN